MISYIDQVKCQCVTMYGSAGLHDAAKDEPVGKIEDDADQGEPGRIEERQWKTSQHDIMQNYDPVRGGQEIGKSLHGLPHQPQIKKETTEEDTGKQ